MQRRQQFGANQLRDDTRAGMGAQQAFGSFSIKRQQAVAGPEHEGCIVHLAIAAPSPTIGLDPALSPDGGVGGRQVKLSRVEDPGVGIQPDGGLRALIQSLLEPDQTTQITADDRL